MKTTWKPQLLSLIAAVAATTCLTVVAAAPIPAAPTIAAGPVA